ncbi:hypothetical protein WJX81_001828 [Elliptochloris bilobata]|uniref:Major facilitator superfamily (MFS) profile domain-containing protein n=1 Tax=Elliptochloris bilobata TaxID=381761 RepID=A0AAW1R1R7_9CHLO
MSTESSLTSAHTRQIGGLAVNALGNAEILQYPKYRLNLYLVTICFVASSGGLLFGHDIGVTGGVTTSNDFLALFFPDVHHHVAVEQGAADSAYCKYNNQLLQLFTSSLFIAGLLAGLVATVPTRHLGRRATMLIAGAAFLLGAGLTAGAQNLPMLVCGRVSLGVGVGFANQAVPLYLSEIAPPLMRGFLNQLFQLATTVGILAAQLINYGTLRIPDWGWRLSLAGAAAPALLLFLGSLALPDTPNSLLERGHEEEAHRVLARVRGTQDVGLEFSDIKLAGQYARQVKHPWRNIFRPQYRPELVMAIMIPFFQQVTGINSVMFYAPVLFKTLGSDDAASLLNTVIVGVVMVLATLIAVLFADRWGRHALFLSGGITMVVAEVVVAALIAVEFRGATGDAAMPKAAAVGVLFFMCLFVSGFAWSWGPLGWLVPSEIQPLETRSAGQGIAVAVNFFFTFAMGQAFLSMLCGMQWGIFLLFAVFCVIMTVFVWVFLPETKGVPIEEMRLLWRQHPEWRRILGKELGAIAAVALPTKGASGINGASGVKANAVEEPQEANGHEGYGKVWKAAV